MSKIEKAAYNKVVVGIELVLAALAMAASFVYGALGVYKLFQLPPGPTSWHDANTDALSIVVLSLPLLVLFAGSLTNWYRTKVMPSRLIIWVAGLSLFLFVLADLAVK